MHFLLEKLIHVGGPIAIVGAIFGAITRLAVNGMPLETLECDSYPGCTTEALDVEALEMIGWFAVAGAGLSIVIALAVSMMLARSKTWIRRKAPTQEATVSVSVDEDKTRSSSVPPQPSGADMPAHSTTVTMTTDDNKATSNRAPNEPPHPDSRIFEVLREQEVRTEARHAVAGSEELRTKLEALIAQRDELLRSGRTPAPRGTASELLDDIY